jgi:hypothetical protein
MQPESSDGFASVRAILPEEGAALLPGGSFRFLGALPASSCHFPILPAPRIAPLVPAGLAKPVIRRLRTLQNRVSSLACRTGWRYVLRRHDTQVFENFLWNWLRCNLPGLLQLIRRNHHPGTARAPASPRCLIPVLDSRPPQRLADRQSLFFRVALTQHGLPGELNRSRAPIRRIAFPIRASTSIRINRTGPAAPFRRTWPAIRTRASLGLRAWGRHSAILELVAQNLLRGFCQIAKGTRQLLELLVEHATVVLAQPLPLFRRVNLHEQQYSRTRRPNWPHSACQQLQPVSQSLPPATTTIQS